MANGQTLSVFSLPLCPITTFLETNTLFSSLSSFNYLFIIILIIHSFLWKINCYQLICSFFSLSCVHPFLLSFDEMVELSTRHQEMLMQFVEHGTECCYDLFYLLDINIDFSPVWLVHQLLMKDWVLDGLKHQKI